MDLSKAKTILILAFLCLNTFLCYKLWLSPQSLRQGSILSPDEIARAESLLTEHGFELTTAVPKQIPQLALLLVSRPELQETFWVDTFLPDADPIVQRDKGSSTYLSGSKSLKITESGHVSYKTVENGSGGEASRSLAENYLRDWKLWNNNMKLDLVIPTEDGARYRFVQTYQGFPLFFSTMEVYLKNGIAAEVQIEQSTPVHFSERQDTVISALAAVEAFIEEANNFPNKRIMDISLGYFSGNYIANRLETTPVWRIATADGNAVYINAFTGESEKAN